MAIDESAVRRLLLLAEVTDFLYREADLLDERRYEEWLGLLADDYQYAVPLRMNVRYDDVAEREQTRAGEEICWFDEGKATTELRVAQLATGLHWAEEPVSRVTHLVTNIRLESSAPPEVEVSCRFVVYRNRVADESDFLVGRRRDPVRRARGGSRGGRRGLLLGQAGVVGEQLLGL